MKRLVRLMITVVFLSVVIFTGSNNKQMATSFEAQDSVCIEDDGNKANALKVNTGNGQYTFCVKGATYSGTGSVSKSAGGFTIQHNAADRRLAAIVTTSTKKGSVSFQSPIGKSLAAYSDSNTADSSCGCR